MSPLFPSPGFVRWELRTPDVAAARSFYEPLLGHPLPDVSALPEMARARGAKPHWLGHLSVVAGAEAAEAFVARGATRLGGGPILRDPYGAILAVSAAPAPPDGRPDVVWQQLLVPDPQRAAGDYGELFGLEIGGLADVPGHGSFDLFSWGGGPVCGSLGDIRARSEIHPQWLFFFRVPSLPRAIDHVQRAGGLVIGPTLLPDGREIAVCDDPQGGAFGLMHVPG